MNIISSAYVVADATPTPTSSFQKVAEQKPAASASPGPQESVSLSPLAQSLSGAAGDLFSSLNDKLREKLVGLVQSGTLSAEELADGLSGFVKSARMDTGASSSSQGFVSAMQQNADQRLAQVSEALSIAAERQRPGADQSGLQARQDALAEDGRKLRRDSDAWKQRMLQDAQKVLANHDNSIRLGEGSAMARLRDLGVGEELAEAAK